MNEAIIMNPPVLSKERRWVALLVILLGQFVVTIDMTVLNIALPDITKELMPTSDQLLWIVDIYSLVLAGFLIAVSAISDRVGRKVMLLAGCLIFGIGSALVYWVDSAEQLIAIRAFLGIGGAMIMPVTISMVRSIFTEDKERAFAVAAWSAISCLGMAAGPLIGGVLLEHFAWHSAFLVNIPIVGIALVFGIFVLPEVKVKEPGKFDLLASVIALVGMVALLWGIKHLAAELEFNAEGILAVIGGLVLMALFVYRCKTVEAPIVDLSLFKSKVFTAGVIATMACTFALATLLYMLSQWLQLVHGDGTLEAGMKLVPMALFSLVSSAGASALAIRFEARHVVASGLGLAALSMIMLVFFRDDLTLTPVMISTCLVGIGIGALAIGASLIMVETPIEKASSAGSLQEIAYDLGNVLGVATLGSLASIIYRGGMASKELAALGLDKTTGELARQSFGAATEIAKALKMPDLRVLGAEAFTDSVIITSAIGGAIILVVAVMVWMLIPKGMKLTGTENVENESVDMTSKKKMSLSLAGAQSVPPTVAESAPFVVAPNTIMVAVDVELKQSAERLFNDLGLTMSGAVTAFLKKAVDYEGIPFEFRRQNLDAKREDADCRIIVPVGQSITINNSLIYNDAGIVTIISEDGEKTIIGPAPSEGISVDQYGNVLIVGAMQIQSGDSGALIHVYDETCGYVTPKGVACFPEGGRVSINQMTIMLQEGGTIVADKSGDVKVSAESMILSGDNAPMISLDGTVACVVHSDGSVTLPNGGIVTSTNAFCDSVTISALTDHEENQSDANVVMA